MLTPSEINEVADLITRIFRNLETELVSSVVRRLTKGKAPSSENAWQFMKLSEVGALRRDLFSGVLRQYRIAEKDLETLVEEALSLSADADIEAIKKGLEKTSSDAEQAERMRGSDTFKRYVDNAVRTCKDRLNLTGTRAVEASERAYREAVNKAFLRVHTGTATLSDAVKEAVGEIGRSGIGIVERQGSLYTTYSRPDGRVIRYSLDSAVRRDVVTTLNKTAGDLTMESCGELGVDLVETSWHLGARHVKNPPNPWSNHDEWQGRVFSLSGKSDKYPDFYKSTGYGEVDGLCGINCRHSFSPYFEEVGGSSHEKFPTETENERHYKEQQTQRAYERRIRALKREQIAYRAGGFDKEAREAQGRLNAVSARYEKFLKDTNRTPIESLTQVGGYHRIYKDVPASQALASTKLGVLDAGYKIKDAGMEQVEIFMKSNSVEYRPVEELKKAETSEESVAVLGGLDGTKGSCSSLALAYAGRHNGLDVIDYRGGKSCECLSTNINIERIATAADVNGQVVKAYNDFSAVHQLVKMMQDGKEYYLATGRHAAIVRNNGGVFEYLEMQDKPERNGYHRLSDKVLSERFKCKKSHTTCGYKYICSNFLIDIENLKDNNDFRKLLGYINTATDRQVKGEGGSVR